MAIFATQVDKGKIVDMIIALRKRHLVIWGILAIALPFLALTAYISMPKKVAETQNISKSITALPKILKSAQHQDWLASVRSDTAGEQFQLEITVLNPLVSASSVVYYSYSSQLENVEQNGALGSITRKGTYRFKLPEKVKETGFINIILYDQIKGSVLSNLEIKL